MIQRTSGWPLQFGVQFETSEFQDLLQDSESWLRRASVEGAIPVLAASRPAQSLEGFERLSRDHVVVDSMTHFREQIEETGLQIKPSEGMHLQFFYTSATHATYWGMHTIVSLSELHAVLVRSQPERHETHDEELIWTSLVPFENFGLEPIAASTFLVSTEARDAGVIEHRRVQNLVADWLREYGESPLRLSTQDIRVDVAWRTPTGDFVCEVKSVTDANERTQIRDGVGQVIEYASSLDATPILILSHPPSSGVRIRGAVERGVFVLWPALLIRLEPQDLQKLSAIDLHKQYGLT